jgi:PD-(D/E)XK nuclease superfamily protein
MGTYVWAMERLINRRQQGDLGEASAIEWLTRIGATVLIPFGHSPHFDLVAELRGRLMRVQVKTSVYRIATRDGHERWGVNLATNGGNQSWTGRVKTFDRARVDFLFAVVGDGRRWFIPVAALEGSVGVNLGGPKYSEFELGASGPIDELVYGESEGVSRIGREGSGECPSGQRKHTVNVPAYAYAGSNPASPIPAAPGRDARQRKYERKLGKSRQAIVNQKRRITIPQGAFIEAGLEDGARMRARADGVGRIVLERVDLPGWASSSASSLG